jgi:hypothetical protein
MKLRFGSSLFIFLCILFVACGTTRIVTDQNVNADIYLNGIKKGQKNIEIQRTGMPKKIELSAKYQGQALGSISVRRKFEWSTFLIGYFTYGIGFITAWRFPDVIIIPTSKINSAEDFSPWDIPQNSIWMKPLNKSHK